MQSSLPVVARESAEIRRTTQRPGEGRPPDRSDELPTEVD